MTEAIDIHREVYEHLYKMNERYATNVLPKITPEVIAMISQDAYSEMLQMAQSGVLKDYYDRLTKGAV